MQRFDQELEQNLLGLSIELKQGIFEPQPVRRVMIPKRKGQWRPLGIPAIRDRIVQEALRMVMEPIYEADFCQDSFGFRPGRCTMDAVKRIYCVMRNSQKYFWAIEGDIASYFDTVHHRKLMKLLKRRIKDKKVLDLIWKFLKAGVMERKLFKPTERGVPQGGVLSPLLANIYLHELDKYMEEKYTGLSQYERVKRRRQGKANFIYARYADDFVVMANGTRKQAEAMKEELYLFLRQKLRLRLSKEKTEVTHLNNGFTFLGIRIHRKRGGRGKKVTGLLIPDEALARVRAKIIRATDRSTHADSVKTKIIALNRIIEGWCQYYRYTGKATTQFSKLEYVVFWQMAHWLGRKFRISMPEVMRRYRRDNTFAVGTYYLKQATSIKTRRYRKPCKKPNPYTTGEPKLERETLDVSNWTGQEDRPGRADLRELVLKRDEYTCQLSGRHLTKETAQVDHIKPYRKFKRAANANRLDNLQTIHADLHKQKTKSEQQMESRMLGN